MDLKYILRQIIKTYKKHYILATAITLILAIGMSVNITVFMIINAALFRPLPVKEPDKLLSLYDYDIKSRRFGHITYVKQSAVVSVDFSLSNNSPEKKENFLSALARETARLQGINSVCVANTFPLSSRNTSKWISTEFADKKQRDSWKYVPGMHVSRGCFETFDIPLLRGRTFDEREDFPNSDSVIISESLARYYWKESNPLNQHLVVNEWDGNWKTLTVVGVVKDMENMRAGRLVDGSSLNNVFFLPFSQNNSDLINIIGRGGVSAPLILAGVYKLFLA